MTVSPPRRGRWLLLALIVLALGLVAWWRTRSAPSPATAATRAAPTASAPATLDLAATDVVTLRRATFTQYAAVSGSLKARQSAFVKARVAGDLLSLSVREGEAVRAGQVIGQIDVRDAELRVRQAEQQALAAQAQLAVAERTLANNQALVGQGFISATALDTAKLSADSARATWQAAQAALDLARKGQADASLVAPLAGRVAQRLAQPGERLAVDAKVVEIVDLSQIELEAAVSAQDVVKVREGARARVTVDGLAEPLAAQVARINPSASSTSRTVNVYLSLPSHPALRQGLFAQGQIDLGQHEALVVPSDALRLDQPQPALLVIEAGQVQRRPVRVGLSGEVEGVAVSEVLDGVPAGAQALAARVGLVRAGTPVRLPASAAR